jgi:hypothetical protein
MPLGAVPDPALQRATGQPVQGELTSAIATRRKTTPTGWPRPPSRQEHQYRNVLGYRGHEQCPAPQSQQDETPQAPAAVPPPVVVCLHGWSVSPNRGIEEDVLPAARRHGMGTLTYSPLASDWLSGRWRKNADATPTSSARPPARFDMFTPGNQRKHDAVEDLAVLAEESGLSLIEMWSRSSSTIPASPPRSSAPAPWSISRPSCPPPTAPCPPTCSTASTRSSPPAYRQPRRQQTRRPRTQAPPAPPQTAYCINGDTSTPSVSTRPTRARHHGWLLGDRGDTPDHAALRAEPDHAALRALLLALLRALVVRVRRQIRRPVRRFRPIPGGSCQPGALLMSLDSGRQDFDEVTR